MDRASLSLSYWLHFLCHEVRSPFTVIWSVLQMTIVGGGSPLTLTFTYPSFSRLSNQPSMNAFIHIYVHIYLSSSASLPPFFPSSIYLSPHQYFHPSTHPSIPSLTPLWPGLVPCHSGSRKRLSQDIFLKLPPSIPVSPLPLPWNLGFPYISLSHP